MKKKICFIIIIVFVILILYNLINWFSGGRKREILSYMEKKYNDKFVLDTYVSDFPSFMQSYFLFYGHLKSDKTMTFMGEYEYKDNNGFKIYDDYDVMCLAREKANELKSYLDKYMDKDFEIICFPMCQFGRLEIGELERYKGNISFHFLAFINQLDYKKIDNYIFENNNSEIDILLNDLNNKYLNYKSEDDGKYYYSRIDFIKTKKLNKIRSESMTEPLSTFDLYDYNDYVYENDEHRVEEIIFEFKDSGIEQVKPNW